MAGMDAFVKADGVAGRASARYILGMATALKHDLDDDELVELVEAALDHDDGAAAAEHLAAGFAIYYTEPGTPAGSVIKECPDGTRMLVSFDRRGVEQVIDGPA